MTILYPHYSFKTKNAINTPCREFIQVPFTACFMFFCQCFDAFECITETYRQLVVYLPYWSTSVWEAFPLEFSLVGDIETSSHDMFNFINFGHLERFAYTCNNKMLTSYTTFICVEYMTKKCNLFQIKDDIGLTNSVLFLNFKKQRIT